MLWDVMVVIGIFFAVMVGMAIGINNHTLALSVSIIAAIGATFSTIKERYAHRCSQKANTLDKKVNEHLKTHHMKATKR